MIIARTDARSTAGLAEAVARAEAYAAAGADLIFVETLLPVATLGTLGYRIVIFPADLQLAAMQGMERALAALRDGGSTPEALRATFAERDDAVRLDQ